MTEQPEEYLLLKWGTLKGWQLNSQEAQDIMREYLELGLSMSAIKQKDTPRQTELVCQLIDAVDGAIVNDWSGESMSKDEAKRYVKEYRA